MVEVHVMIPCSTTRLTNKFRSGYLSTFAALSAQLYRWGG